MKKFFAMLAVTFALAIGAVAQTSYIAPRFTANFNGPVTATDLGLNPTGTGTTMTYDSNNNGILESVSVRTIVKGYIPVTLDSAMFYANQDANKEGNTVVSRTSKDTLGNDQLTYEGHPLAYICVSYVVDGVTFWKRTRYIIVDEHTAIFITMIAPQDKSDRDYWTNFEYGVEIK